MERMLARLENFEWFDAAVMAQEVALSWFGRLYGARVGLTRVYFGWLEAVI